MAVLLALFAFGCGLSREEIGETVRVSMQEMFETDPRYKELNLLVVDVVVVKLEDGGYRGVVNVRHRSDIHRVQVEITTDGDMVLWQIPLFGAPTLSQLVLEKETEKVLAETERRAAESLTRIEKEVEKEMANLE